MWWWWWSNGPVITRQRCETRQMAEDGPAAAGPEPADGLAVSPSLLLAEGGFHAPDPLQRAHNEQFHLVNSQGRPPAVAATEAMSQYGKSRTTTLRTVQASCCGVRPLCRNRIASRQRRGRLLTYYPTRFDQGVRQGLRPQSRDGTVADQPQR